MTELFGTNPSERMNPSFRQEDEEMANELKPLVIGPPAYASPDPKTAEGRLVPVEEHPFDLSDDYGQSVLGAPTSEIVTDTDYHQSSRTADDVSSASSDDLPEDRDSWNKSNWQSQAASLGLATGGTKDALRERVEAREGEIEEAKSLSAEEWKAAVDEAEDADALADLRSLYGASGAEYSTVESAFEAKQTEFDGSNN